MESPLKALVFFRLSETQTRPALILRQWSSHIANLLVFVDGSNDDTELSALGLAASTPIAPATTVWATSRIQGDGIGQWQYPAEAAV